MSGIARQFTILAGCLAVLLVGACNSPEGRKWQRVFLDGVPPEPASQPASPTSSPVRAPSAAPPSSPDSPSDRSDRALVVHRPYANHECNSCHESVFSQRLVSETADLCQICHKNVFARATFRHAPAESGYCLGCHNPHQAQEKALLTQPARALCLECHAESDFAQVVEHERAGQAACHVCHNPHGSERRYYLREGWQTAAGLNSAAPP